MVTKYEPYLNIGPGEFIKEELEARNWRQEDLAEILGLSLKSVNQLMLNKQAITIETAKLLSRAFGQSPQYWISLETNYRLRLQNEGLKESEVETKANIYKYMPVKEMMRKGWIRTCNTVDELVNEIRQFWGLNKLDFSFMDTISLANFRKSEAFIQYNKYYALTWLQMAQKCATIYQANRYSETRLEKLVFDFHRYTAAENGVELFLEDLSKVGVKFLVLSHLQKTYIDGASFYDEANPVIVYTKRYDRIDNFWFTVAHEIAHILLHLKKENDFFIDNLDELITDVEKEADNFAAGMLQADEILAYFEPLKKYISKIRVMDCAQRLKVNPAIVVGVLQHYGMLSRRNLNRFKVSVSGFIAGKFWAERYTEKIRKVT